MYAPVPMSKASDLLLHHGSSPWNPDSKVHLHLETEMGTEEWVLLLPISWSIKFELLYSSLRWDFYRS